MPRVPHPDPQNRTVPVLTIDGPSGSGKGTIARAVAESLGWHLLDSGALYRAVGYAAVRADLDLNDTQALTRCAEAVEIAFRDPKDGGETRVLVNGRDATDELRTETAGAAASTIAAIPALRQALVARQLAFRQPPGLVADGRDMGTVIFPDAVRKVFLTASAEERAQRRYKQLNEKGLDVTLSSLLHEIEARDARDATRAVSPLKPAADAVRVDTTGMPIPEVVAKVLSLLQA